MGKFDLDEKTKVTMPLALFWSVLIFCCAACVSAAISYAHVDARLARIESDFVQHRDLQEWVDELRVDNPALRVPSLVNRATRPDFSTGGTVAKASGVTTVLTESKAPVNY